MLTMEIIIDSVPCSAPCISHVSYLRMSNKYAAVDEELIPSPLWFSSLNTAHAQGNTAATDWIGPYSVV